MTNQSGRDLYEIKVLVSSAGSAPVAMTGQECAALVNKLLRKGAEALIPETDERTARYRIDQEGYPVIEL